MRNHSVFVEVCGCLLLACIFRHRLGDSLSMTQTKRAALTADDLSRRQEEPHRKWARLSPLVNEANGDSSDGIPERDELIPEGYQEESFSKDDEGIPRLITTQIILNFSPQRLAKTDFIPPLQTTLCPCLQSPVKARISTEWPWW